MRNFSLIVLENCRTMKIDTYWALFAFFCINNMTRQFHKHDQWPDSKECLE